MLNLDIPPEFISKSDAHSSFLLVNPHLFLLPKTKEAFGATLFFY